MSVKVMTAVFESDLPAGKRLVMLALADHANDEGVCYPSISRLCERTGMKERTVQTHIRDLEAEGYLSRDLNAGQNGCNVYKLDPAKSAPPHKSHPRKKLRTPPQKTAETPADSAPEPSGTINEPSFSLHASEIDVFSVFNEVAQTAGWPQVQSRTPERLKAAKARMKDCGGFENWREELKRAAASPFLSGEETGSTPATFDWLNKKPNFTKLMEGNYDNRSARKPHRRDTRFDPRTDPVALAARNRRASWQDRTGS